MPAPTVCRRTPDYTTVLLLLALLRHCGVLRKIDVSRVRCAVDFRGWRVYRVGGVFLGGGVPATARGRRAHFHPRHPAPLRRSDIAPAATLRYLLCSGQYGEEGGALSRPAAVLGAAGGGELDIVGDRPEARQQGEEADVLRRGAPLQLIQDSVRKGEFGANFRHAWEHRCAEPKIPLSGTRSARSAPGGGPRLVDLDAARVVVEAGQLIETGGSTVETPLLRHTPPPHRQRLPVCRRVTTTPLRVRR